MFIIYINDFSKCLKYSKNLSFADDTTIILIAKNNKLLFQKGNKELENIDNWLIANKLSLNIKKQKEDYGSCVCRPHCCLRHSEPSSSPPKSIKNN